VFGGLLKNKGTGSLVVKMTRTSFVHIQQMAGMLTCSTPFAPVVKQTPGGWLAAFSAQRHLVPNELNQTGDIA